MSSTCGTSDAEGAADASDPDQSSSSDSDPDSLPASESCSFADSSSGDGPVLESTETSEG